MSDISAVFPAISFGQRGVQSRSDFVQAQEAGQDVLSGSWSEAANQFATQANSLKSEVNSLKDETLSYKSQAIDAQIEAKSSKDSASLSEINTKANADRAEAVVIPTEATYNEATIDKKVYDAVPYAQHGLIPNDDVNEIRPQDFFVEVNIADTLRLSDTAKGYKVRFTDGVYDMNTSDFTLPKAPFATGSTDELLDDKVNGLTTQTAHSKGDIVVTGNELVTGDTSFFTSVLGDLSVSDGVYTIGQGTDVDNAYALYHLRIGFEYTINIKSWGGDAPKVKYTHDEGYVEPRSTYTFVADTDSFVIRNYTGTDNTSSYFDNISVKLKDQSYIALQDTTAGDLLSDTTKFKPIPHVTKQVALLVEKTSTGAILNTVKPLINMYGEESVLTYEADIFGELGYSQKADRVWTDGNSEFILLGLKGYLNGGGYSFPYNYEYGTKAMSSEANANTATHWYSTSSYNVSSLYDCFQYDTSSVDYGTGSITDIDGGMAYTNGWSTTRPEKEGKLYDKTYIEGQGGLICYTIPNAKTPTYKHMEEVKRNLVDGYIENGVEITSAPYSAMDSRVFYAFSSTSFALYTQDNTKFKAGDTLQYYANIGGTSYIFRGVISAISAGYLRIDVVTDYDTGISAGSYGNSSDYAYITKKSPYQATQGSQTTTVEALADPACYTNDMKSLLASGDSINLIANLVDDSGNSNIPDGAKTVFKLNKSMQSVLQVLKSTDSGVTWTTLTLTTHYTVDTVNNTVTFVSAPLATDLILVSELTANQPAISIPTPQPIEVVDRDLIASNSHSVYAYNGLTYGASGKVATGGSVEAKGVDDVVQDENKDISTTPAHNTLTLDNQSIVASKALVTQTANATQVFTQEMVWDSVNSDWGDTNQFDQLISGSTPNLDAVNVQTKVLLKPSSIKLGE